LLKHYLIGDFNLLPLEQIGFDIDGVVADTMGLFFKVVQKRFQINEFSSTDITEYDLEKVLHISPEIINAVINEIVTIPTIMDMEPYDGAIEILYKIGKKTVIHFVTARSDEKPITLWLQNLLPGLSAEQINVCATGNYDGKLQYLNDLNIKYFVEDRLETCDLISQNGITPIVFEQPWNNRSHPYQSVTNWNELGLLIGLDS